MRSVDKENEILHKIWTSVFVFRGTIGKQGVLNIFQSKCLVFAHFWSNFDEIFMTGVKLQIFFRKNIFSPNMIKIWHLLHKNWRAVLWNLKFFIETYQAIPEKTSQNIFFHIPALHGENAIWKLTYIFGIFFFQFLLKRFKQKSLN